MMVTERTEIADASLPLARFRSHLRLGSGFADDSLQDDLLKGFLKAALSAVEARTGRALIARDFAWTVSQWRSDRGVRCPIEPVSAIVSAMIGGADMRAQLSLVPEAGGMMVKPLGATLPTIPSGQVADVVLHAGYGPEFDDLPGDLQQAVLLLATHYYEFRGEMALSAGCMPFGVSTLIERYRPVRLGAAL